MTRAREICYDLEELIADCATNKVSVTKQAREDAKEHYSLMDQAQILDFLSMGDFKNQELDHDSTDELDKGNDAGTTFDAYTFRMGLKKYVYFAFYRRRNGFWIVKSFHPPQKGKRTAVLSHTPFANFLERDKL